MQVIFHPRCGLNFREKVSKAFNFCVYCLMLFAYGVVSVQSASAQVGQDAAREIPLNQIIEIKLPENSAAVLLGNPEIADILSQGRATVVISGKRIGQTNLLVKDRDQNIIRNIAIAVSAANTRNITIFRGAERTDFACSQSCEMLKTESKDNQASLVSKQGDAKK